MPISKLIYFYNFQKEAEKIMVEKFQTYSTEQKTKIEDLGIIQQKGRKQRKRKY